MGIVIQYGPQWFQGTGDAVLDVQESKRRNKLLALEEQRYQDSKQRAAQKLAMDQAEEARRSEEFGWARQQHARMASVQDAGLGGSPAGAQPPQSPVQGPPAGPDMGPPQPGSANFEAQLQSSLETHRKLAETMMKIDPVKGAEYADRYLTEAQKASKQLALEHARSKAAEELGSGIMQGQFNVASPDGKSVDPTFAEAAKGLLQQLGTEGADPTVAIAQIGPLRAKVADSNYRAMQMAGRIAGVEGELQTRTTEGKPVNDEILRLIADAKSGAIGPEEWDKKVEDALHGRLDLKQQLQMLQAEKIQADAEAAKARAFMNSPQGMQLRSSLETDQKKELQAGEIEGKKALQANEADLKSQKPAAPATMGEKSNALMRLNTILQSEFPDGRKEKGTFTKGNAAEYDARKAELRQEMGLDGKPEKTLQKQSPEDMLRAEVNSGKIKDNAALEKRAKELGVKLK